MNTRIKWKQGLLLLSFLGIITNAISVETHNKNEYPLGFYADDALPNQTVYLTFDDGPSDWTDEILDTLHENNIKATFFICANWQPKSKTNRNSFIKYQETLERMIAEGNVLGNHTKNHYNLSNLSSVNIEKQLDENQQLLKDALGLKAPQMTLIRTPFGQPWMSETPPEVKIKVANAIKSRGLVMMWSRHFNSNDSKNWVKGEWYEKGKHIDVDEKEFKRKMLEIYNRLINRSNGKGMVILFHDTHLTTVKILPEIIQTLKIKGYHFATLEEYVQWRWRMDSKNLIMLSNPDKVSKKNK
ncbi:MAG: polysaccharide deacetylase family protein [Spirochaetia bacterium]|nr:polysaccharide deacetylase family protein [Spirochaetia bacterium]